MRPIYFILIFIIIACTNTGRNSTPHLPSIVGVCELTQLNIALNASGPTAPITNKKDIYTEKGIYHDTDAESTAITDTRLRNYRIIEDRIVLYDEHGTLRSSKFKMPNYDTLIIIVDEEGSELTFKRLSKTSSPIPPIKKQYAKILYQGRELTQEKEAEPINKRHFSIELLNIPIENIIKYKLKYGEKEITAMSFAGESKGDEGTTYSYWLEGECPKFVEFNISYKDGIVVQKRIELPDTIFNRYGISSVLLDYADGKHQLTFKYNLVLESDPDTSFYFDEQGNIDRIFITRVLGLNRISREYSRENNKLYISMTSLVNEKKPYVYVRNGSDGKIKEIEAYHHDHPKSYRIQYSPTFEIKSATTKVPSLNGLFGPNDEKKVEDFSELKNLEIPNLSFLNDLKFDLKKELSARSLTEHAK